MINKTSAINRLQEEFKNTCLYQEGVGGTQTGSNLKDEIIQRPSSGNSGNGNSKLELFSIIFGIVMGQLTLLGMWLAFMRWGRRLVGLTTPDVHDQGKLTILLDATPECWWQNDTGSPAVQLSLAILGRNWRLFYAFVVLEVLKHR